MDLGLGKQNGVGLEKAVALRSTGYKRVFREKSRKLEVGIIFSNQLGLAGVETFSTASQSWVPLNVAIVRFLHYAKKRTSCSEKRAHR